MSTASRIDTAPAPSSEERANDILSPEALDFVAELHGRFEPRRQELLAARRERADELQARRHARLPRGDARDPRGRLAGRRAVRGLARPPRRDHRADRPQARHQRAQLGRQGLHGRLRGRDRADVGERRRRPRQPDRRDRPHDHLRRLRRQALRARRGDRDAAACARAAGTSTTSTSRSRAPRSPAGCSTSASTSSTTPSGCSTPARGRTSTCPSWSTTSRRGCGTTSSRFAEEAVGVPHGTSRATVLIETLPAAFQMDEILYELRDHSYGLNAGRWDYIFSMIKCFRDREDFVLPDRNDVKMTVPFMKAYTELLVKTCHAPRRLRDGRHGGADPLAQGRGGQPARDRRRCARTRSARPRPASTAPGSRTRTSSTSRSRRSTPCSATSPTRSTSSAPTSR